MNWRNMIWRIAVASAIFFGAAPAWTQNEGASAPNPSNAFSRSGLSGNLAQYLRPQVAQAAPRRERHTQRVRASSSQKPVTAAAPQSAAPETPEPAEPAWPKAQDNVGAVGLVPVVVKTVREMVEPPPETPAIHENELSDIDLAAAPAENRDRNASTDGRASADEEPRGLRQIGSNLAAFAENANALGNASWLESVLLVLAGAIAAAAAMRVFAA